MEFTYKIKKRPMLLPVYKDGYVDYEVNGDDFIDVDYYVPDEKVVERLQLFLQVEFGIDKSVSKKLFSNFDVFPVFAEAYLEELKQEFWADALKSFKEGE